MRLAGHASETVELAIAGENAAARTGAKVDPDLTQRGVHAERP